MSGTHNSSSHLLNILERKLNSLELIFAPKLGSNHNRSHLGYKKMQYHCWYYLRLQPH